jgi:tetratricopeptide (TPR) repeat protein
LASIILTTDLILAQATSTSPESLLSQAMELEKSKDYAGAENAYRQALITSPDDPEILKRLGVVCQEQHKFKESVEVFQEILKRAPLYPGANLLLGISHYGLNQFDKAMDAEKKELVADPKNRDARLYLALALSASGRLFEAIQQLETLRADNPEDAALLYQLVVDYKAAAQQMAQRLAKLHPDSGFTHAVKGEVLADNERFDDAIVEYKEVLRKNPDFPGIHTALGEVYWRHKDLEKAREELKLALLEDPNQPLANYYLADILTTNKNYPEAIPHLEIALSVYPKLTRAYFLLGKCYAGTGDLQRAVETFNTALELDPNYPEVHYQLHVLYARLGDKEKSQAQLQIFEKLTKEGDEKDKKLLEESLRKQKDSGTSK